jgi:hypothetical protein
VKRKKDYHSKKDIMKKYLIKKKAVYDKDFGGAFRVRIYHKEGSVKDCYLEITTTTEVFEMRLDGRCYAYGYLLASARQGKDDNILGYCRLMWIMANSIYQDEKLFKDIVKAINAYDKRLEKEAQKRANAVTDEQEQAAEALMTESIRYADMSKKERKAAKEEMQQAVQELTKEESDEQA